MHRRLLRLALLLAALLIALPLLLIAAYRLAKQTNGALVSGGETRRYLLYVPDRYDPATPTPLVISLHGFIQWPAQQRQLTRWNDLADQHGFLVVYPSGAGLPLRWRAGTSFGDDAGPEPDVTFIAGLIDSLQADYNVDPARIYANGMSNGAGMSFVLSCHLAERIAAVGLVAGAYAYSWDDCQPARAVPAIVFHGTDDRIVPFAGGRVSRPGLELPDISQWVSTLANRNGCDGAPRTLPAPETITAVAYAGCDADVVFYTIAGGGHTWPGGQPLPRRLTGATTTAIDATRLMWDFFQVHPLPPS
jgi:polyhydroxybutyrate depolymerase